MTPWELAKETEHSQQRALFAWANNVEQYGFAIAARPEGYTLESRERLQSVLSLGLPINGHEWKFHEPCPLMGRLFAIHNQGHGDKIRGGQAKAEGVKKGVPDVMLPVPWGNFAGLFIELKKLKGGRVSAQQSDWIPFLQGQRYRAEVAIGWLEAAGIVSDYLGAARYAPKSL